MQQKHSTLVALSAAALVLNGTSARANPPDQKTSFDYRYSNYTEKPIDDAKVVEGSNQRYTIDAHQLKLKAPVATDTELTFSGVVESMSGASPWYVVPNAEGEPVQVMSGATIDESRVEVGVDFRSYNERSESTLSLSHSTENDYASFAFGYAAQWRMHQNRGTLSGGINASKDFIDATDADIYPGRPVEETKNRVGGFLGFSYVMTKNRLAGITLGYSNLEGYLSDAYKLAWVAGDIVQDSRPKNQSLMNAALMLREYFPAASAALHFDLRYFQNDWEITSGTVDVAWYQNLGDGGWQLIPSLRYYSQTAAIFYQPYYLSARSDGFYSSDYRLSEFSATSARVKLSKAWRSVAVNLMYESYSASGDHPAMLSYDLISLGLKANF
ncbi:uncharacterized protein DUF3570 [Alteromonadaceae bacterium 2753L.S.0a.02]|nr:uncharacterized protein DUF3570 [Alteromonadaceae bacterium 2753L.S.0a.02]